MADSSFRINRGVTLNPQATAPTAPTNGDIYYDSALGTFVFYDNGFWINLASRADVASAASLTSTNFPATIVQSSLIRLTGSTAGTIHGVSASTDGNMVVIYNNTNQLITIAHQSGTEGTAANRIVTHTAASIVVPAGMTFALVYDSSQSRWVHAAPAIDGHDKLFEDRNILLTQGGLITYTGTTVQFTEALALEVNQREAGGSPVVISLASTTRTVSATGRMIYAVIDRVAGTAVVTDDAATLPAAVPLNQEVFLIAKRVDAGDGTKRLYWRNGMALNEGQTVRLGASGSGSGGSGTGDDINTLRFKASFTDSFSESATSSTSAINSSLTTGTYSAANALYRLSYDASKTVTGTGTAMTLSGTPAYTVVAGDILVVGTQARRIATVNTQTSYVLESAFTTDPAAAVACVSQAVHTNDVRAHTENSTGLAMNALISDSVSTYMLRYEDSAASGDAVWDFPGSALIAASASADNSNWSSVFTRITALSSSETIRSVPVAGSQFRARFFANATSGSGAVNVLYYKAFLHEDAGSSSGTTMDQAYCLTSGAGAEINCSVSSDTGKTRITTTWAYAVGVNPGTQQGQIMVHVDGKLLPRFIDNTVTASNYYKEISSQVIELETDYSGAGLEVDIKKWVSAVDTTSQNSSEISYLQGMSQAGFQGFVDESSKLAAVSGTPGAGQFRTFGVLGRASIPDLANDLRARIGIDRIVTQQIVELQNEFGPSNERVFGVPNDDRNLIRFVGSWSTDTATLSYGQNILSPSTSFANYIEIVFYGTGLNFLMVLGNTNDVRATVDGGAEGGNILPSSDSGILNSRNYSQHNVIPVVSGLSLGLHTVKLRNNTAVNLRVSGFEILNESSSVKVQPGTAYQNGKKLVSSAQSAVVYNSGTYDSILRDGASQVSLSTRGNRTLVYQKSDGSIGKSAIETNSSQANLASADHTNEEVVRTYNWREFGAGRVDDFSLITTSALDVAFTLDDGSTCLVGKQVRTGGTNAETFIITTAANNYFVLTFIGTGLDMTYADQGATIDPHTVSIDGNSSVGTLTSSGNGVRKAFKIVSGLPYGLHSVKILRQNFTQSPIGFFSFTVYQPKKPALPSGAIELADYNTVANYSSASLPVDHVAVPNGVIGKTTSREAVYVGSWSLTPRIDRLYDSELSTSTNGNYAEYTFFGTGFVLVTAGSGGGTSDVQVTVNGVLNATGVALSNATNLGGGSYRWTGAGGAVNKIEFTGLTLGKYTVRVTAVTGGAQVLYQPDAFLYITPIHAVKPNFQADIQNTLPVGSCSISDNRKISAIKEIQSGSKFRAMAQGVTSNPTTTSSTFVPIPEMSLVVPSRGGWFEINFTLSHRNSTLSDDHIAVFVNGVLATTDFRPSTISVGNNILTQGDSILVYLSQGTHKVDGMWKTPSGTMTAFTTARTITVKEL